MTDEGGRRPPLRRSRRHKVIAGVCGGLGRYFDIDPVIFRVVLAVLAITGGLGLLIYGLAWLFIPLGGDDRNEAQRLLSGQVAGPAMTAVLVAFVGTGLFLSSHGVAGAPMFPLLLVAAVTAALFWSRQRRDEARTAPSAPRDQVPETPPAAQPPPTADSPSWWREPLTKEDLPRAGLGRYLWGPDESSAGQPPEPGKARPDRSFLSFMVFCLALLAGAIGLFSAWSSPLGTQLEIAFACALATFGLALLVGSRFGRLRGGTIFMAIVTMCLLAAAAALPKSIDGTWQHRVWTPATAAQVRSTYSIGLGDADLSLLGVDPQGKTLRVKASVGLGQLLVRVPDDVRVEVTANSRVGAVDLPGDAQRDVDVTVDKTRTTDLNPTVPAKERHKGVIKLDLRVDIGHLEVIREAA